MVSKKKFMSLKQVSFILLFFLISYSKIGATDDGKVLGSQVEAKLKIIELIEDELSSAYSFMKSSPHRVPHYEVLDHIYPEWHMGKHARGRQFWLTLDFLAHLAFYRVDYVYMTNNSNAIVEGKRLVVWTKDPESTMMSQQYWPFQYWANLASHKNSRCVKCVNVTFSMRFRIKVKKSTSGNWQVVEEKLRDQPSIPNEWEKKCDIENLLHHWGFRSQCGTQKKTPFSL